ncbi:MAG: phage tail tape measure protein, partial [Pyrinomonadaceae bacterium]
MSSATYELAILLSLRDAASGRLDRFADKLRATGKEGRKALQDFEEVRKSIGRDLAIGSIGLGTLALMKRGTDQAGDFQAAVTDLRMSVAQLGKDGETDVAALNTQMHRFEQLGVRLGNSLPGSTQDFLEMFSTLKQGGLDTEAILNGAGEAAAYLAVVMKEQPKLLAEPYAQFGKQFQLKPEDYAKSADLFARAYRATGLRAEDLIEGSKFFQLRAGAPLGLKNMQGAETGVQLMAALKSYGLEGGVGGREAATFFSHMATHKDALQKVKKDFGVDLQIFDKKGNFLGIDNVFKQMEKLRGLKTQQQIQAFKELGGEEGAGVGNIFMQMGAKGWQETGEKMQKVPPLQEQINESLKTYNAKMESLSGTLDNLKVTAFTPMIAPLSTVADKANSAVGAIQEFSATHPALTSTITYLVAAGAATMTLYSGIKMLQTGWRLWRMASAIGAKAAGEELAGVGLRAAGLRGTLASLSKPIQITLLLATIGFTIAEILELKHWVEEKEKAEQKLNQVSKEGDKATDRMVESFKQINQPVPQEEWKRLASTSLSLLNKDRELEYGVSPDREPLVHRLYMMGTNPFRQLPSDIYKSVFEGQETTYKPRIEALRSQGLNQHGAIVRVGEEEAGAKFLRERAGDLKIPQVMSEFRS